MAIGENLKRYRKKAGLTQKQLAEKCHIAEITIRQYETGKRYPKLENVRKITDALGVYVGDLVDDWTIFSHEEISADLAASERELIKDYRALNEEGQEKATEQVKLLTKIPEYRKED